MTRPIWPFAVIAVGIALTACSSSTATSTAPSVLSSPASTASPSASGITVSDSPTSRMTMASGADRPTKTSLMVCGSDVSSKVQLALKLPSTPKTRSTFANDVYTCTYDLPMGPLVLSVQHALTGAAAGAHFAAQRARLAPTQTLDGLGDGAYATPSGTTVVIKDNEILTVDATGLPTVFGSEMQKRTDLSYETASIVLGCWTGDE